MSIEHPLLLVGLLLIPLALVLARRRLRRVSRQRRRAILCTRAALLGLLVLSLATPFWQTHLRQLSVVFIVDAATMSQGGTANQQQVSTWLTVALQTMAPYDTATLIPFNQVPQRPLILTSHEQITPNLLKAHVESSSTGADIASAVRLGLGLLPTDGSGRIVLLSSGGQTAGDLDAATALAAIQRTPIDVWPLDTSTAGDVAIERLNAPNRVRQGDTVPVALTIRSQRATTAQINIGSDGTVLTSQSAALHAGITTLSLQLVAGPAGFHTITTTVSAPGDPIVQNNSLSADLIVDPPARLLIVSAHPEQLSSLVQVLSSHHMQVTIVAPGTFATQERLLHSYDGIVLADIAATSLSAAQTTALQQSIYQDGRGLLVIGGPHSFSEGAYAHSPLEAMLPVWSVPPARLNRASLALQLVLDKSGSMDELEHGVTKMSMVQKAADLALSHLHADDSLGVLAFDDQNHILFPLQKIADATNADHVRTAIAGLTAGGDTMIYPALQSAFHALQGSSATSRHIILLTDGQGESADFDTLVRTIHKQGVTLSTVAVGSDADQTFLRRLSVEGGGRFYHTNDPHDIPSIFVLETRLSGGPPVITGKLPINVVADSPLLRSLAGHQLPIVHGYNLTVSKDDAQVILNTTLNDPLLATWQYGLGRVATWMSDSGAKWADLWAAGSASSATTGDMSAFWHDLSSWITPAGDADTLHPVVSAQDGGLTISVDARDSRGDFLDLADIEAQVTSPTGQVSRVALSQVAPGDYTATVAPVQPGAYDVAVGQYNNDQQEVAQGQTALAIPYSPLFDPALHDANMAILQRAADGSGGSVLTAAAQAFDPAGVPEHSQRVDLWQPLALLGLLLLPVDVGLRVMLGTPEAYRRQRPT